MLHESDVEANAGVIHLSRGFYPSPDRKGVTNKGEADPETAVPSPQAAFQKHPSK
jgi:hypothetical protein